MLKRIQIQHLTLGMYLHEFSGSWMDHLRRVRSQHLRQALQARLGPGRVAAPHGRVHQGPLRRAHLPGFVKSIGIYPVGSLVRLTSGRIGIMTEQSPTALTPPIVKVFFSTKSDLRSPPEVVNLAAPDCNEKIVAREDPEKWRFPDLDELWSGFSDKVW